MIEIITFGEFDIRYKDQSILEEIGSHNRLNLLLKYFLTYEGKKILPETIVEDLMEDKDLKEPQNVLRTQISRLRRLFDESFYSIEFSNGYYVFNLHDNCLVDVFKFEDLIKKGNIIFDEVPLSSVDILKEALFLYKGDYLPEIEYGSWIAPFRSRVDRLYLKGLANYLYILEETGDYHEIVSICEKAIQIKPYEEFINKYFMEALIEIGQKRYALSHYEYFTSKLYNDLKIVPSPNIKRLYKELQNNEERLEKNIDLMLIDHELKSNRYSNGALLCEIDYFKFIYNLILRNKDREDKRNVALGIITLDNIGYTPLSREDIKHGMNILLKIVYRHLRKTDILSKWNDSQLMMLLFDILESDLYNVNNRLQESFKKEVNNKNIILNIKFKSL